MAAFYLGLDGVVQLFAALVLPGRLSAEAGQLVVRRGDQRVPYLPCVEASGRWWLWVGHVNIVTEVAGWGTVSNTRAWSG